MAMRFLVVVLFFAAAAGCAQPQSAACVWPDHAAAPLDLRDAAQQRHLNADVRAIEEIGVRVGDATLGEDTIAARMQRRRVCTAQLFAGLAATHSVSAEDIERARGQRDWRIDAAAVFAPMALVCGAIAFVVSGRVRRRFLPDEAAAAWVATVLFALVLGAIAVMAGEMWAWMVEMWRVGDSHLSYRAARMPWVQLRLPIFAAGTVIFLVVSALRYRRA